MITETEIYERRKVSIRVSLRDMLRLIVVDTLRSVQNVGFIAGRLIKLTYITCVINFE